MKVSFFLLSRKVVLDQQYLVLPAITRRVVLSKLREKKKLKSEIKPVDIRQFVETRNFNIYFLMIISSTHENKVG